MGVDTDMFLRRLQPIYEALQWDEYDTALAHVSFPTRKRALANTLLEYSGGEWKVDRIPTEPYIQPDHGGYRRSMPRIYPEVPLEVTEYPELQKVQTAVAEMIREWRGITKMRFVLTFLRAVHDNERGGNCAFENLPHQDGADAIVSALVINRTNLETDSGRSSVHTLDETEIYGTVLQPGEGILQDDRNLKHHITNIKRRVATLQGFRDILGVDAHFLSHSL